MDSPNKETYWRRNNYDAPEDDDDSDDEDYQTPSPPSSRSNSPRTRNIPRRQAPPKRTANRNAAMQSLSSLKGVQNKNDNPLSSLTKPIEAIGGAIGSGMDAMGGVIVSGAGVTVKGTKKVAKGTKKVAKGTVGAIGTVGGAVVGTVGGAIGLAGKTNNTTSLNSSSSNTPSVAPPSANSGPGWSMVSPQSSKKKKPGESASSVINNPVSSMNSEEVSNTPLNDIIKEEDEEDGDGSSEGPGEREPWDEDEEQNKKTLVSKVHKGLGKTVNSVGIVKTVGTAVNGVGRQALNILADSFQSGQSSEREDMYEEADGEDQLVPIFADRGRGRARGTRDGSDEGTNMAMMMPNSPGMRQRSKSRSRSTSVGRSGGSGNRAGNGSRAGSERSRSLGRSRSPGRRVASPGRRNIGPPRRKLDNQRSERPGILQPNVAPSHKRFGTNPPPSSASPVGLSPPKQAKPLASFDESDDRSRNASIMIQQRDRSRTTADFMSLDESTLDVPKSTRLHLAASDPDSTIQDLREALNEDPSYASVADEDGKLPLHIISENDMLTDNLGEELDHFILDELIPKNRRALVAQSNDGQFPFVQALLDWVDLVNEIPQQRISEMGMELDAKDDEDAAERLIPWNVVIDDVASWGIRMLSIMIEREPLKANWVLKIVEVIASIPCFLKNILLIDDDATRRMLLETRLVNEVILHEDSVGPWLVYMIVSDDEVAQNRALLYMKLVTDIEEKLSQESGNTSRSRVSAAFVTSNHQIQERKHKVYLKAASLPAIIPALMQLTQENFTEASSSSIVQFILDEALFQPETALVILLDFFFLFASVVMYSLCSNNLFRVVNQIRFAPVVMYYVNQTAADMCANGTLTDESSCMYFDLNGTVTDLGAVTLRQGSIGCGVDCQVCLDPSSFGDSVVQYFPTAFVDVGSAHTLSCYDGNLDIVIDLFLIASIIFMSTNALYFTIRQLCTWMTVPHRFLRSQLGILRELFNLASVTLPVVMLTIFLAMVYDLPTASTGYVPPEFHGAFLSNAEFYAAFSAVAVGLLYLKILFYFKVLNQYTATYIFSLGEVVKDIFWFFCIMVIIIFAFSQMFYTTLSCTEGDCRNPDVVAEVYGVRNGSPFQYFYSTLLYSYAILLGQIDLYLFDTPFTTLLWVLYTFAVVIVVLNFLIAIVGDSYDKSMTKIEMHFGRARLMFMVEVSAFLSYIVAPITGTDEDIGYRRMLLCGSVKGTIIYFLFAGGLITGFAFLSIERNILERSGEALYASLAALLSIVVVSPFLWKFGCLGCMRKLKIFDWVGKILTAVFRVFLGKSIRGDRSDKEKKDWGGKIAHLIDNINISIRESEEITNSKITNLETALSKSTSKLNRQMELAKQHTASAIEESSGGLDRRIAALESDISEIKTLISHVLAMMEERRDMDEASGESGATSTSGGSGGVVPSSPKLLRARTSSSVYEG